MIVSLKRDDRKKEELDNVSCLYRLRSQYRLVRRRIHHARLECLVLGFQRLALACHERRHWLHLGWIRVHLCPAGYLLAVQVVGSLLPSIRGRLVGPALLVAFHVHHCL
jgi:hypothetical protein